MNTMQRRRIAVGGFLHETNTFQPAFTTYSDFADAADRPPLVRGVDVLTRFEGLNASIAGSIAVLRQAGATLVPLPWASATPSGYVTRDAFERITKMILSDLRVALPVDAICLSLHGSMVTEHIEDAEGELLKRIRDLVGTDIPVVASVDLHSNTTAQMFELTDGLVGYCTYPHLDMVEAGEKVAHLLIEMLTRQGKPYKAYRQIPFLIPLTWQCTTIEPAKTIYAEIARLISSTVRSVSFMQGFPAADIHECGGSVVAYGWNRKAVDTAAHQIWQLVMHAEPKFAGRLWEPEDAVNEAMHRAAVDPRPVLLADTQDNPGVGGSSDTVGLLRAMLKMGAQRAVLGILHDPDAALAAHQSGIGTQIRIALGAKTPAWGEEPLDGIWHVERLGDGNMICQGPMLKGWPLALGPMALLRNAGVFVVVSSHKFQPMDEEPFLHVGVEPRDWNLIALKSSVHFRAAFEAISQAVLVVKSPGAMIVDPSELPFKRLRAGLRMKPLGPAFPLI